MTRRIRLVVGGILIFAAIFIASAATVGPLLKPSEVWPAKGGPAPNAEAFAEEARITLGGNEGGLGLEEEISGESVGEATTTTLQSDAGSGPSETTSSTTSGTTGSGPSDEEFYKDWKSYENQQMGVSLKLPPEFRVDHEYDNDAAFINYDPESLPGGEKFPRGKVRINLFALMNKQSGESPEEYLRKNVTSSSKNVVRVEMEIGGRTVLVETGVDSGPYESFYFDAGSRLVALVILGNPADYEVNKLLLAAVAYSVNIRD